MLSLLTDIAVYDSNLIQQTTTFESLNMTLAYKVAYYDDDERRAAPQKRPQ